MRRMLTFVPALLVGVSLILTDGMIASMPHQGVVDGSMIWLAQGQVKKKKKVVKKPKPPPGAAAATAGQTGDCICSTNAQGSMTCTGKCN